MTSAWSLTLIVAAASLGCFAVSAATKGDPLGAVEVIGGVAVAGWAAISLGLIVRSARLARALDRASVPRAVAGIDCQVIRDPRPLAFVAGFRRPAVFVTTRALDVLSPGELRAVVLHEWYHARTFAPVRAAVVDAWRGVVGRVPGFGTLLASRLTALEIHADRYALGAGCRRRDLASALLKLDPSPRGVAFSGGGDGRLQALVGAGPLPAWSPPVEWLPLLVTAGLAIGCRLAGTASGI